jgi:hypothetical protein
MKNYSNVIFNSGPVQTADYVNNRYDIVHDKLYKNALNLLIIDIAKTDYHNKMFTIDTSRLSAQPVISKDDRLDAVSTSTPSSKYIENYIESFKKTHKFIEIKNNEYFKPSSVLCISSIFPFERKKFDLTKYWNQTTRKRNNKDISLLQLEEDTIKYAELIYIDYVQGKCKFKSKLNGEEFWVTFDYINDETKVSELYSLKNTFSYKVQNKIFEKE